MIPLLLTLLACEDAETQALRQDLDAALQTIETLQTEVQELQDGLAAQASTAEVHAQSLSDLESNDALQDQDIDILRNDVDTHDTELDSLAAEDLSLDGRLDTLETAMAAVEPVAVAIGPLTDYVSVDTSDDSVVFTGANVYVQSGAGATDAAVNGLGNLIVGYDEDDGGNDKSGSHNLVIGSYHDYMSDSGLLVGTGNTISGQGAVAFGYWNTASGERSTALGGSNNTASAKESVVVGGAFNSATDEESVIVGGGYNSAAYTQTVVVGGYYNSAEAIRAVVLGGASNIAGGANSTVYGGYEQETTTSLEYAP